MQKSKLALALGFVLCSVSATTYADTTVKSKSIEVTATRVERDLLQVPVSVSVVTEEQISKSGAATIADVLKDVPGVSINNDGSQGLKRIGIRGEDAYRTLVLVDGQKVSEHKSMSGAPMLIAPSQVERIEVIKGPNSVLYGADAIGGVVNIITKKAADKKAEVDVGVSYDGAGDVMIVHAGISGKTNGFAYRVAGSTTDSDNLKTPTGTVKGTDFSEKSFDGMFSYDFTDKFTMGVNFEHFNSDINSTTEDASAYKEFYVKLPVWKRNKVNVFAEITDFTENLVRLRLDGYHQVNQKIMDNHIKTGTTSSSQSTVVTPMFTMRTESNVNTDVTVDAGADNKVTTNGFTAQSEWQLGDSNYLIAGTGIENDDLVAISTAKTHMDMDVDVNIYRNQALMQSVHQSVNRDVGNKVTDLQGSQRTVYGFLSNENQLPADFVANYGLRYTNVKSELGHNISNNLLTGGVSEDTESGSSSNSRTVFNAGLVYNGFDNSAIRFNFGQGFRAPILQEKYVTTSMGGASTIGNPNLKPETSNSFELGYRFANNKTFADLSAFYTRSKNYITTKEVAAGLTATNQYYNVAEAKTFGLEAVFSYTFDNNITPYTSFTYMRRSFDSNEGVVKSTYNSNTPKFTNRTGLRYVKDFSFVTLSLDGYARMQSARDYTKSVSGQSVTSHQGGFTTANFEVSGAFGLERQYVVSFAWLNINDKKYYLTDALAEAGSHAVLTFNAKF